MASVQHIYCSAVISKKMCDALTSFVFSISAAKGGVDEFVVYLVTGGGNPSSGMELYNFFKARPRPCGNAISSDVRGPLFGRDPRQEGSGCQRPQQSPGTQDVDHPLQVVGQHVQAHLGFDLLQFFIRKWVMPSRP